MLSRITIRDLVIVRQLDLALDDGMTALTGETGAGKSILVDALGLALGDRADAGLIRDGADRAEIAVAFELAASAPALIWLTDNDLDDDGALLVRRVISRNGRSRAYVNGSPVPVATLRALAEQLVDIHGQHAHQSLLRPAVQRERLDEFGGLRDRVRQTTEAFTAWRDCRDEFDRLSAASADRAARLDYLAFQLEELDGLECDAETLRGLETEHDRLAHAERLLGESQRILSRLADEEPSLEGELTTLARNLGELETLDPSLEEARNLVDGAAIQLGEAANALQHYLASLDADPGRLEALDAQLAQLHDLARKHRVGTDELEALRATLRAEADRLQHADSNLQSLAAERDALFAAYLDAAEALSGARVKAATRLGETITQYMQTLGMKGGRFQVRVQPRPERPAAHGLDHVTFEVTANPGQAPGTLSDVASGGELSRISLAVQVATADCAQVPTLIFDEVDVGIGGATAEIVGQLLRRLGGHRQVLCVTHLPQVASQGHRQLRVVKLTDGQATETRIEALGDPERVDEIARMLGGVSITEKTRRHAEEMIRQAQQAAG
jgi:DNA repair protein RecN (Recombination protein N)